MLVATLVIRWKRLPHWSLQPNSVNSYVCRKLPICKNSNPSPNSDNSYVCQGLYILEILTSRWTLEEFLRYPLRILTLRTFCTCICSSDFSRLRWKGLKFQPFEPRSQTWTIQECIWYPVRILTLRTFSTYICSSIFSTLMWQCLKF